MSRWASNNLCCRRLRLNLKVMHHIITAITTAMPTDTVTTRPRGTLSLPIRTPAENASTAVAVADSDVELKVLVWEADKDAGGGVVNISVFWVEDWVCVAASNVLVARLAVFGTGEETETGVGPETGVAKLDGSTGVVLLMPALSEAERIEAEANGDVAAFEAAEVSAASVELTVCGMISELLGDNASLKKLITP